MESLLKPRVERTVILNYISQDNNKFLEDNSNEPVKLHSLESSMEESVFKFQSGVEAEQQNGRLQQKISLAENKNPSSRSNQ